MLSINLMCGYLPSEASRGELLHLFLTTRIDLMWTDMN